MLTLTPTAAAQIRLAANRDNETVEMSLRIAAKPDGKGGIDYAMGFDNPSDEDSRFESEGISIVVSPLSEEVLEGTVLDFTELDDGKSGFVFLNPNDPKYEPPAGIDYAPAKRVR